MSFVPTFMAPRCKHCNDGIIVIIVDKRTRKETTCSCARGQEQHEARLREALLKAFHGK